MTLHTLNIPDEPADLPRWLERRIMAPDFGRFVAELSAHFPDTEEAPLPRPLVYKWLDVALAEGLEPIPSEVLTQLLKHPAALAEFQERIVTDGGVYWDEVIDRSDDLSKSFKRGERSLDRILSADAPPPKQKQGTKASKAAAPIARRTYKTWAIVSTGVAACLAVAVGLLALRGPDDPGVPKSKIAWGWGKPSGLATDQRTPKDYLNKLADNVEEWSQYQPSDAEGVGTRIAELRIGCTRLMHSNYGSLAPADKAWLLEQCRAWAKLLDQHQQALDAGTDPLTVRARMDETVRTIAATLREKSNQVA
jgi:hypothetical protein